MDRPEIRPRHGHPLVEVPHDRPTVTPRSRSCSWTQSSNPCAGGAFWGSVTPVRRHLTLFAMRDVLVLPGTIQGGQIRLAYAVTQPPSGLSAVLRAAVKKEKGRSMCSIPRLCVRSYLTSASAFQLCRAMAGHVQAWTTRPERVPVDPRDLALPCACSCRGDTVHQALLRARDKAEYDGLFRWVPP